MIAYRTGLHLNKDFCRIRDILDRVEKQPVKEILGFLESKKDYVEKISTLQKEYNIGGEPDFNIFTSIAEKYRYEELHSDILRLIFNPRTPKLNNGSAENLEALLRFIEKEHSKINKESPIKIDLDFDEVDIIREKPNRIDILIFDQHNNCVFIESKINYAEDGDNQIGNYYGKLKEEGYNVQAVVYLAPTPEKKLDRDKSLKTNREEIEKILVEIPVVNKKGDGNLVDDVFEECIERSKQQFIERSKQPGYPDATAHVYLTHYRDLLKYLGGSFMTKEDSIKVLQEIYADKNALKSFRVMGKLWEDKDKNLIPQILLEYFRNELGFKDHSGMEGDWLYKPIRDDINIGFASDITFGFVHTPHKGLISGPNKKLFKKLLGSESLKNYFTDAGFDAAIAGWVYGWLDLDKISCLGDIKTMVMELERLVEAELSKRK